MTQAADADDVGAGRRAFGRRVRSLRLAAGLTQEDLAHSAGVHRTYLSSLERGQRNVSLDNIIALARALRVAPGQLMSED